MASAHSPAATAPSSPLIEPSPDLSLIPLPHPSEYPYSYPALPSLDSSQCDLFGPATVLAPVTMGTDAVPASSTHASASAVPKQKLRRVSSRAADKGKGQATDGTGLPSSQDSSIPDDRDTDGNVLPADAEPVPPPGDDPMVEDAVTRLGLTVPGGVKMCLLALTLARAVAGNVVRLEDEAAALRTHLQSQITQQASLLQEVMRRPAAAPLSLQDEPSFTSLQRAMVESRTSLTHMIENVFPLMQAVTCLQGEVSTLQNEVRVLAAPLHTSSAIPAKHGAPSGADAHSRPSPAKHGRDRMGPRQSPHGPTSSASPAASAFASLPSFVPLPTQNPFSQNYGHMVGVSTACSPATHRRPASPAAGSALILGGLSSAGAATDLWHCISSHLSGLPFHMDVIDVQRLPADASSIHVRFTGPQVAGQWVREWIGMTPPRFERLNLRVASPRETAAVYDAPMVDNDHDIVFGLSISHLIVLSWNIAGDLPIKLQVAGVRRFLFQHDVIVLQESHLRPGQHESLDLPPSHIIYSFARPASDDFASRGGGVLVLVRASLPHTVLDCRHPDFAVLSVCGVTLLIAYVPPESSPHCAASVPVHPWDRLTSLVALHSDAHAPEFLLLGDLNARIAREQVPSFALRAPRVSPDTVLNVRGRRLLDLCTSRDLCILNGTPYDTTPLSFTSFQHAGSAVIDYGVCSAALLCGILSFHVSRPLAAWSDHATVQVVVRCSSGHVAPSPGGLASPPVLSAAPSHLDTLLTSTLASRLTPEEAVNALYGPCRHVTPPVMVYIAASTGFAHGRTGAGICVFWGQGSPRNIVVRAPGIQSVNAALLYAVTCALRSAPAHRSLQLVTTSTYVIHTFCHWAAHLVDFNWTCCHADAIHAGVQLLQARCAPVRFKHIPALITHVSHTSALAFAASASRLPDSADTFPLGPCLLPVPCDQPPGILSVPAARKVSTALPPISEAVFQLSRALVAEPPPDAPVSESHRGRACVRRLQAANLQRFVDCDNDRHWWKLIRDWSDAKPCPPLVSLPALRTVFEDRMNPPTALPAHWDTDFHRASRLALDCVPDCMIDLSAGAVFSPPFSLDEIAKAKSHIHDRSRAAALGADGTSFEHILAIPNPALQELCQECIQQCSVPSSWRLSIIAAILKHGKPANSADSYRLIGLESCLLKFITLIIEFRLHDWAEAADVLPPEQNSFRKECRTNNPVFILRTAIDVARNHGEPLFVAFVDLTNAFPSTDHVALWLKLLHLGISGPIFDFLCMLYRDMRYSV
ncbi:hypothetical protein EVG20_g10896 [Dentipellis fragilis]|uniref:Reverse transcriptase domain-containing protein n=1 Tax=Dentipellis fragilis TaxID=205917 RepID=A0A4Y9XMX4_9AGAM|nr:hypothetical protein EVG20_g10896 [Dentipellis fragilis]